MVDLTGVEPVTSRLQGEHSPKIELQTHIKHNLDIYHFCASSFSNKNLCPSCFQCENLVSETKGIVLILLEIS